MKTNEALEIIVKGAANKRRIHVLKLLARQPDLLLERIAIDLKAGYKSTAEHIRRMAQAGLVDKKYKEGILTHHLTERGKVFLNFLRKLE